MGKKEEKDELEDVETIPRAQAEKEMHEAAKNVRKKGSRQTAKADKQDDEEEEVTPATRKQAQEELLAAVRRVREEGKKKSAGNKDK